MGGRRGLWLGVFAASVFLTYGVFFVSGDIVSGDNIAEYEQTIQIVDHHRLTFTTADVAAILGTYDLGLNTRFGLNRDGTTYTQVHGLGQPLLTIPGFVAARRIRNALHLTQPVDMTLWCFNWLMFAVLSVLLVLFVCQRLTLTRAWTVTLVCGAAFASPIWLYSTIPYNVVGESLATLAAMYLCVRLDAGSTIDHERPALAGALALVLVLSIVIRPFMASALPAFVVWVALAEWNSVDDRTQKKRVAGAFAIVLLTGGAAIAGYNTYYFGSPISSPYHDLADAMTFNGQWLEGFAGTFLSPLKSPLYFFPLIVLLPISLAILLWRRDRIGWFVLLFLLPQFYLMPKYSQWNGGPDLFARFWTRVVPVTFLAIVAAVPRLGRRARTCFLAAALVFTGLGIRAELLTVMTDEREVYATVATELQPHGSSAHELDYHQSPLSLTLGFTPVADAQRAALGEPRRFLFVRSVALPTDRLWAALAGLLSAIFSLWRLSAHGPPLARNS